jgi:hypothetical protein
MRMRKLALFVLPLVVSACPKESDYTPQIRIAPGDRTQLIPHMRQDKPQAGPARVHAMKKGEELAGPNAVGRAGDLVLENDEVVFVIEQLGSSTGFAASGGNIVDAADARTRKDELGQVFTYFGTFPRQGVYDTLDTKTTPDGAAWVIARGHELYETKVEVTTTYKLTKNDRAVLMETTLKNTGDKPVDKLSLGDAIQWGGAEKFSPGKPVGFKGPSSGPFLGGVGRLTSYAIAATEGDIESINGSSWSDTTQKKDVKLEPGASETFSRVFLVGERPDAASLIAELTKIAGGKVGALELSLADAAGKPVDAPPGAKVILSTPAGAAIMSIVSPSGGAAFGGEVPPGSYLLSYASGGGRKSAGAKVPVEIAADKVSKAAVPVTAGGAVKAICSELKIGADGRQNRVRGPCKATFEGLDGTPAPDFGSAHVAGPARNQITSHTGEIEVPVSPGKYELTLSRGPEFSIAQIEVTVGEGATVDACSGDRCVIQRVVDTAGYLATDFHQHSMLGADAPVSIRDRVISNVAEGVEIAVASEHNYVADFSPVVRELKLEASLVTIPGNEITTDALKKPWGHVNVFPIAPDPTRPRGGAVDLGERTAAEVLAEMRALPGNPLIQVNHPRAPGVIGYFTQLKFDPKIGVGTEPGYDAKFDALEVWNGRNVHERDRVVEEMMAMIETKHPVTATADTDTHGIVGQEAGYPRTYVRVGSDRDLDRWDGARTTDLLNGVRGARDVVLTNGPFLRVTANGAGIGGVARAKNGVVEVKIHVECAPWMSVERLRFKARGMLKDPSAATADLPVTLKPLPSGAMGADVTRTMAVRGDAVFLVSAEGSKPLTPVLGGDPSEILPFAMTGAIWIDGDGDGKSLGR